VTGPNTIPPPTPPPDAAGHTNVIPPTPAPGTCRTGEIYNIYVNTPVNDTEAFTVFEPGTFCAGKTYPVVLQGAGYSGSRQTDLSPVNQVTGIASPGNIAQIVAANFAVISLDERGFGEDGGTVRVMDPNFEGPMDLSVMDWAQAKLPWLAYGPTLDGKDPHEPIFGSIGGSYGGMYQYMLLDIDKRHRLRAIAPQISPSDLNYSLFPNAVVKSAWDLYLFVLGETGGSGISYAHEDPFLSNAVVSGITQNQELPPVHDFFGYHSSSYFCNGTTIATDGDAGSVPLFAPHAPPKINALITQGMRDTLFTFNNAYQNYSCFQRGGGDVRLLTYQYGHNALQIVPDPYVTIFYPPTEFLDMSCGSLDYNTATVAWFDQYLKGMQGAVAAAGIPTEPCLSTRSGDAFLVPTITTGHAGTHFTIPPTTAIAGTLPDVPTVVPLGPKFTAAGTVGGLPRMELNVQPVVAGIGEPILFFGIGQLHAADPLLYDLLDNQLTPIRGVGEHDVDMTGIAARIAPGDQLALLIFGEEDQYDATGSLNLAAPAVVPVTVSGNVWVPLLNNPVTAP
jgi:ABC-2 type transport system ATP-binding protein